MELLLVLQDYILRIVLGGTAVTKTAARSGARLNAALRAATQQMLEATKREGAKHTGTRRGCAKHV